MADDIKYMDVEEFADEGYLQEVNRIVLHPAGLAIERRGPWTQEDVEDWVAEKNADHIEHIGMISPEAYLWAFIQEFGLDKWHLSGVWDYRDDPEGMAFGSVDPDKRERVREEQSKHQYRRNIIFGLEDVARPNNCPGRVQHVGEKIRRGGSTLW